MRKNKLVLTMILFGSSLAFPLITLSTISCSKSEERYIPSPPEGMIMKNVETGLLFDRFGNIKGFEQPKGMEELVIPDKLVFNSIKSSEYYGYETIVSNIKNRINISNLKKLLFQEILE